MKKLIYLLVFGFLISSCSKVEDACIDNPQEFYFKPIAAKFKSCSSAEYVFWTFGDGEGDQGPSVQHFFSESGNFSVTQTAYSKDGKKTHEESVSVEVGYVYVEEVVFTKLLSQGYIEDEDYPTLYLKINDTWSKPSIHSNPPRTFEFEETVLLSTYDDYEVSLVYREGSSDVYLMTEELNPYESYNNPQFYSFSSKFEFDLYWYLGAGN